MKIGQNLNVVEAEELNKMGIALRYHTGQPNPFFERKVSLSREEEDRKILKILPIGHTIPLFPATRARLLSQAR